MSSGRKLNSGKFIWDSEQKEKLLRDAGLHLMKYQWTINKSIQGVPIKMNEFKIEITLVILGPGDQLDDINGKLRHLVTLLKMTVKIVKNVLAS